MTEKKIDELLKSEGGSPSPHFSSAVRDTLRTISASSASGHTARVFPMKTVLTLVIALALILPTVLIPSLSARVPASEIRVPMSAGDECSRHPVTENLIVRSGDQHDALAVRFSVPSGLYHASFQVRLSSASPDVTLLYTTDGSLPSPENALVYTDPITVERSVVIRACGLNKDGNAGEIYTGNYLLLAEDPTLDVISLVVDPVNFSDPSKGYLAKENNVGLISAEEAEKIALNGSLLYVPLSGNADAFSRDMLMSRIRYSLNF